MKTFMDDNFLLSTKTSESLYHNFAKDMPIFDYHCHLNPKDIAEDRQFKNITEAWLEGDHYKWRGMRSNGISEEYCTGNATPKEKFLKWAETVPNTIRNPLFHWTHLELQRYFGITDILTPQSAERIYDKCTQLLQTPEYSCQSLLKKMNVSLVCTTDDPVDDLKYHKDIKAADIGIKVLPTFRPDKGMAVESTLVYLKYVAKLSESSGVKIESFKSLIEAIDNRHQYFHDNGGRLSDHGVETFYAEEYSDEQVEDIFSKLQSGKDLTAQEIAIFKTAFLYETALMNNKRGWVQQYHFGVFRNNNTRMFNNLGPDTGFDSIADYNHGDNLRKFLNKVDTEGNLTKTILYNINPSDNDMIATMIGNFQDGSSPGKIQFGSGWWFLDQKKGMIDQMNSLSSLGLLSRFVGMLTDSRSFLSFPRHEYFRRILCDLIGTDVENGEIPNDIEMLGKIVQNICFNNAVEYFGELYD